MGSINPSSLMRTQRLRRYGNGVKSTHHGQNWDLNPDGASLRAVVLSCAFIGILLLLRHRSRAVMSLCLSHEFPIWNSVLEFCFICCFILFDTRSHWVSQANLKLTILPPMSLRCWDRMPIENNQLVTDLVLKHYQS